MKFYHRILLPDGSYTPGSCNHGPDGGDWPTTRFGLPEDLTGKTVLDIGAYDGFFSFEAEKRGAQVVATNPPAPKGPLTTAVFAYVHATLESNVEYFQFDIEEQLYSNPRLFDIVLCYGVLYHLKNPLGAMYNLAKITSAGGFCLLETAMAMDPININSITPTLEYHPHHEGDPTNFFYPNQAWIEIASREVGFASVELVANYANRATYRLNKDTK